MVSFNKVTLDTVCDVLNGDRGINYPSSSDLVLYGIPFINAGAIENRNINFKKVDFITESKYNSLSGAKFEKGDIVFCLRGSLGKYAMLKIGRGAPASSLAVLRCKSNSLNNKFLFQLLGSEIIEKQILSENNGSSQPNLSAESVKRFLIPLPGITEQIAISGTLSDVDSLISSLQKLIEKKKAIKQGSMQELLTGKKRLPGFSGEWSKQQLGDICNIVNGGTPSTSIAEFWNGKILWCTPTDITSCSTKYIYTTESKITESGLKASSATLLPKGALLLCSRATIGEVRIAGNTICTNQGFKSLVVHQNISNEWLYYMVHVLKFNMLEKAIGSTFLEISKKDLAELDIIVPEFTEQKAIAQVLSDMDSEIELLEKKLAKYQQIKQGMMQELLTGRIRLV